MISPSARRPPVPVRRPVRTSTLAVIGSEMASLLPNADGASKEDDSFGIIQWEVDKDSITTRYSFSQSIDVGGIPWSLRANKGADEQYLKVFLHTMYGDYSMESVNVAMEYKLINHKDDANTITKKCGDWFKKHDYHGYSEFIKWDDVIDEEKGFVKDNKLSVQIGFSLSNLIGFRIARSMPIITSCECVNSSAESPMFGNIRWEVQKDFIPPFLSTRTCDSIPVNVGGMLWSLRLGIRTGFGGTCLSVNLIQSAGLYDMRSAELSYDLKLINHKEDTMTITEKDNTTMFNFRRSNGHPLIAKWNDVINEEKGFIKNGKFIVQAEFSLSNFIGLRNIRQLEFVDSNEPNHDITLLIGGAKINVNKQYLSIHSPVFQAMFFGQFIEQNQKEIELKDVNRWQFVELLKVIYPPFRKITDDTVGYLLKLGDRYDIDTVIYQCEHYLFTSTKLSLASKLVLADQYSLFELQDYCIDQLKTIEDVKALKKSTEYKDLSNDIKSVILDMVMIL